MLRDRPSLASRGQRDPASCKSGSRGAWGWADTGQSSLPFPQCADRVHVSRSELLAKDPRASPSTQALRQQTPLPSILRTFNKTPIIDLGHMRTGEANSPFLMLDCGRGQLCHAPVCSWGNGIHAGASGMASAGLPPDPRGDPGISSQSQTRDVVFWWVEWCLAGLGSGPAAAGMSCRGTQQLGASEDI